MSEPPTADFERQHPLSWISQALAFVRSAVLPAVVFLVFVQGIAFGWLAIFLVLPTLAVSVARHFALSYRLGRDALVVRDGILARNERRIQYSRIQNLDEVQSLVHRLLGIVAVKIETASGGRPEAVLQLGPEAAARLRSTIFHHEDRGAAAETETESAPPLLQVPLADLVRLGLIQNRGMVVVAAALGVVFQGFDDFLPWQRITGWLPSFVEEGFRLPEVRRSLLALQVVGLVVAAYLLLSLLSIALTVTRFYSFTLRQSGDDLTARFGLFSRVLMTVPRRRIQRLAVEQTLLHRLWRRLSIQLDTAGGQQADVNDNPWEWSQGEGGSKSKQWLAPVASPRKLPNLVAAALPRASRGPLETPPEPGAGTGWRPLPRRAAHRLFRKASLAVLIVTFVLVWFSRWSLLLPLTLPAVWWICSRSISSRFYWATEDALWWRRGWPGRSLVVVPYEKIQAVVLSRTPFDRRHRMARITLDTAGSGMRRAAHLVYLEEEAARRLAGRLSDEASRREFVWS